MTSYRTGNKNARNIYRVDGDGTETHIGCMFTEEDGKAAVEALNAAKEVASLRSLAASRLDVMQIATAAYDATHAQAEASAAEVRRLRAAIERSCRSLDGHGVKEAQILRGVLRLKPEGETP